MSAGDWTVGLSCLGYTTIELGATAIGLVTTGNTGALRKLDIGGNGEVPKSSVEPLRGILVLLVL